MKREREVIVWSGGLFKWAFNEEHTDFKTSQYDHYDSLGQPFYTMQKAGCNVKMDTHWNIPT